MPEDLYADVDPADAEREHDILTAGALRFDGYRYEEAVGFDHNAAAESFYRRGTLPDDSLERMCMLFMLQRYLCKWGGEYEPHHGRAWRLYRTLFLSVGDLPVPPPHSCDVDRSRPPWRDGVNTESIACVRRIHTAIIYNDDAPTDPCLDFTIAPAR